MLRLAAIGLGRRATGVVNAMNHPEMAVKIAAICDPGMEYITKRVDEHKMRVPLEDAKRYDSADELLKHAKDYDGVIVGTRCHLHTEMACKVAKTGLPLYLEKPVAITRGQLDKLGNAFAGKEDRVVVSFPLRVTPLYVAAERIVRSGRLGKINQVQANNNVSYGGVYFGDWYRNYDEVGGLWLQKATHDFDYINHLLEARPVMIAATTTQVVYGGDKPHDLLCSQCDEMETCIESSLNQKRRGDAGGMGVRGDTGDHACCFSRDIRNQDAGSALVMYEGGVHVSYTQNFVTRRKAGKRGAVITGHKGSLEFDWYTEKIIVTDHFEERVDEISVKASTGHSGGDDVLCRNFVGMMRGQEASRSDLKAGLMSVAMCLAARESAFTQTFQPIIPPGENEKTVPRPAPGTEVPVA